jgi:hypothetical protein
MGMSGHLHASAVLTPTRNPQYPLNRKLGGPQSRFGRFGEEKNLLPRAEFEPRTVQPKMEVAVIWLQWYRFVRSTEQCSKLKDIRNDSVILRGDNSH